MIPAPVRYHRAVSIDDALEALADEDARALAGGQSLLPVMKVRIVRPSVVVDVGRLDLRGVVSDEHGTVRIGALTTWDDLVRAPELGSPELRALSECAEVIGDLQVRNRGTIGGSLAHADPASDMPAPLLALGASVTVRSAGGGRSVPVAELVVGPFTTSLATGELLTEVVVPAPPTGSGSAYVSVEHPASGFALAGAAALALPDDSQRVALTGVAGMPVLFDPDKEPAAALAELDVLDDRFAPAAYRRELAAVVVRRALERANARRDGRSG